MGIDLFREKEQSNSQNISLFPLLDMDKNSSMRVQMIALVVVALVSFQVTTAMHALEKSENLSQAKPEHRVSTSSGEYEH